jgi:hypothetical protein
MEDTSGLPPELAQTLHLIRETRGLCPSAEAIVEYEELQRGARLRHRIHPHVRSCSRCLLLVQQMTEPSGWRKAMRKMFGRP